MVNPDLPPRKGAHRARTGVFSAVLPSLVAVAAVLAVVVALYLALGGSGSSTPSAAGSTSPAPGNTSTTAGSTPSTGTSSATSPGPSGSPSQSASPTESSPPASASGSPSPTGSVADVPVVVLNETTRVGLAASVAGTLRGKGWNVIGVGNFRGTVADTTVYYPPGAEAAAAALAADLPVPQRLRPTFGNLDQTALTIVLAPNYP